MSKPEKTIAFQGTPGAYSDLACRNVYPKMTTLPARAFDDAFEAVRSGAAALAMIPIENSVAGRVADIHHLLPESELHIVAEHFQRVNHHLLGVSGAKIAAMTTAPSEVSQKSTPMAMTSASFGTAETRCNIALTRTMTCSQSGIVVTA